MPTLPDSGVSFTVQTNGQTLTVAAGTSASSLVQTLYSDAACTSSVTTPHTITSDTTYYLPLDVANVSHYISCKQPDGTELWGKSQHLGGITIAPLPTAAQVGTDLANGNLQSRLFAAGGESTLPRTSVLGSLFYCDSGYLDLIYFTAQRTETITSMSVWVAGTAAGATPTTVKFGVYEEDPLTRALTRVAVTANDTTLLAATNTKYTKAFTSTFTKTAGKRYAASTLVVTGAAVPILFGLNTGTHAVLNTENALAPRLCGRVASQTDIPASLAAAAIDTDSRSLFYARLA